MSETLTGIIFCYVAYELFQIVRTFRVFDRLPATATPAAAEPKAAASLAPAAAAEVEAAPSTVAEPVAEPAVAQDEKAVLLRDPATGETCPPPSNYRFAKKWVKEALVKEGLLNKIYKNSELTAAANPVVKQALERFKHLEKYHA